MKRKYNKVSCMDWSGYAEEKGNNGGCYGFGVTFYSVGNGRYLREETTTGEFCPYCNSWNCNGECHEPEYVTFKQMKEEIRRYKNSSNCDVRRI